MPAGRCRAIVKQRFDVAGAGDAGTGQHKAVVARAASLAGNDGVAGSAEIEFTVHAAVQDGCAVPVCPGDAVCGILQRPVPVFLPVVGFQGK